MYIAKREELRRRREELGVNKAKLSKEAGLSNNAVWRMDITVIQQILGHSSVGTTEIYAEVSQENVKREYEKYVA